MDSDSLPGLEEMKQGDVKELLDVMKESVLKVLTSEPEDEEGVEQKKKIQEIGLEVMKSLVNGSSCNHSRHQFADEALQMTFTSSEDSGNSSAIAMYSPGVQTCATLPFWSMTPPTGLFQVLGQYSSFAWSPQSLYTPNSTTSTTISTPRGPKTTRGQKGISAERRAASSRLFTMEQIKAMEDTYKEFNYISTEGKKELSKKIGLTSKQIKDWFHHRRNKDRRNNLPTPDAE